MIERGIIQVICCFLYEDFENVLNECFLFWMRATMGLKPMSACQSLMFRAIMSYKPLHVICCIRVFDKTVFLFSLDILFIILTYIQKILKFKYIYFFIKKKNLIDGIYFII